jgi:TP901 family phage tail tape measure protein
VKWAGDYQSALTKLATTAGESQKNLHMVGQGMLDMAGQVGIGADELAKGMYTVESSGIHGANALVVLKAAAQGAKQENADLGKVTDAVTTALHDYNLPASDAAKVTSQLVTAVSRTARPRSTS